MPHPVYYVMIPRMLWLNAEVYEQMQHEREAHWFCEYGIIAKLTTQSIGYIMHGAVCDVLVFESTSIFGRCLISSLRIFDRPNNPMTLFSIINNVGQVISLKSIQEQNPTKLFIFNELNIQVAEFDIVIDWTGFDNTVLKVEGLFIGEIGKEQNSLLDKLETDVIKNYKKAQSVSVINKQIIKSTIFNSETPANVNLEDEYGKLQEFVSYTLLTAVFRESCHLSLKERVGSLEREIADVICWYENGIFIVQSKALSSFETSQSDEKKFKNFRSHFDKALSQLLGAARRVRMKGGVIDDLDIPETAFEMPIQALIIVGDSYPLGHGDWKEEMAKIREECKSKNLLINIVDLQEFSNIVHMSGYIAKSKGVDRKIVLDHILLDRCQAFLSQNEIHIRTEFAEQKPPN